MVQAGLLRNGAELGVVDGQIGPRSNAAIEEFSAEVRAELSTPYDIFEVYEAIYGLPPYPADTVQPDEACGTTSLPPRARQPAADPVEDDDEEERVFRDEDEDEGSGPTIRFQFEEDNERREDDREREDDQRDFGIPGFEPLGGGGLSIGF
jgi:hypothetical protein